jgi:hypothetical protein
MAEAQRRERTSGAGAPFHNWPAERSSWSTTGSPPAPPCGPRWLRCGRGSRPGWWLPYQSDRRRPAPPYEARPIRSSSCMSRSRSWQWASTTATSDRSRSGPLSACCKPTGTDAHRVAAHRGARAQAPRGATIL